MFFLLGVLFLSSYVFYHFYWKRRNLPPGPIPLPFFGNMLEVLKKEPYVPYIDWHKKYGPVHTFWQGDLPIVEVTDYNLINETFIKDADSYIDRPNLNVFSGINIGGRYGVINTDGDFWRDQRRFALHVFRNFGLGKNLMQERIFVEISSLIDKVQSDLKKGINEHNVASHIDLAVGSIINNLLFGYRFEGKSLNQFYELKTLVAMLVKNVGHPFVQAFRDYLEYMHYVPILNKHYHSMKSCKDALVNFYRRQIQEHIERADHDSEPTDYVEAFLREKARKEDEGSTDARYYSELQLLNMCMDLWLAGQETTSTTLAWGIIYLMTNPEVQEKLQEELDSVIGSDRMITMEDKPKLHYASAVVNEIQRISNLVPGNVLHTTTKDVSIDGHFIAKGTTIIPNICVLLYDEKVFPDPHKFDPSRFLDSNGQWKKVDELVPFSVGKRQCLGEGLARMELFLFTTNVFNHFKIKPVPTKPPSMKRKIGGTISPENFVCRVEKRY